MNGIKKESVIFVTKFARLVKYGISNVNTFSADKGIVSLSTHLTVFRGLATLEDYALFGTPKNLLFNARPKQK